MESGRFWASDAPPALPGIDGAWRVLPSADERARALGLSEPYFVPPDGCADLLLRFCHGEFQGASVLEPAERFDVAHIGASDALFGARVRLGFGGALAANPDALERAATRYFAASTLEDPAGLQQVLLRYVSQQVERFEAPPTWLPAAVKRAVAAQGNIRIEALASYAGVSARSLHRGFLRWAGIAPKQLCRTLRIRAGVALLEASAAPALAEIAATLGFADQAHFHREMCDLWGTGPARLRSGLSDFFKTSPPLGT